MHKAYVMLPSLQGKQQSAQFACRLMPVVHHAESLLGICSSNAPTKLRYQRGCIQAATLLHGEVCGCSTGGRYNAAHDAECLIVGRGSAGGQAWENQRLTLLLAACQRLPRSPIEVIIVMCSVMLREELREVPKTA